MEQMCQNEKCNNGENGSRNKLIKWQKKYCCRSCQSAQIHRGWKQKQETIDKRREKLIGKIKNSLSDELKKRISDTLKDRINKGEIIPWNKGLRKETDEIVRNTGFKISETIKNNPREYYSKYKSILPPFIRKCPKCNREMKYKNARYLLIANSNNSICRWCQTKIVKDETRKKLRIATLKRIVRDKQFLSIGNSETQLLNEQEINHKNIITRQFHIKELGYIVDGYDQDNNIVYEVYELFHKNQKEHDLHRQLEIMKFLQCGFTIIYTEPEKWIK